MLVLVFIPTQGMLQRHGDRNQQVLEFDLQKKGHHLLIAASMDVLPRGPGDFNHDPSLGKFLDFTRLLLKGFRN